MNSYPTLPRNPGTVPEQQITYKVEEVILPQIVSITRASELTSLPPHYLRQLCREGGIPGLAFQSGVKYYLNLRVLADYLNGKVKASVG